MKKILQVLILMLLACPCFSQEITTEYLKTLEHNHDLSLPNWGPYTKNYIGVSHIPDINKGIRFDLSVFPGLYRRKVQVPAVTFESGYHPWEASPNLEYFSFRHELEWKDQVYTDISYSLIDENSRLVRAECVNNTDLPQSLVLHYMASIHFPSYKAYQPNTPLRYGIIDLPKGAIWQDALDYVDLKFATTRPNDNLGYDGKLRAEVRDHGLIDGSGIGQEFANEKGDWVSYSVKNTNVFKDAGIWLRYKLKGATQLELNLTGLVNQKIALSGKEGFQTFFIKIGALKAGTHKLEITSLGGNALIFDGFALLESIDVDKIGTSIIDWNYTPEITAGPIKNSTVLKYEQLDTYYGIYCDYDQVELRQWFYKALDEGFKREVNEHVKKVFYNDTEGHFTNIFFRPISLEANTSKVIYGYVCTGTKEEVDIQLKKISKNTNLEQYYEHAHSFVADYSSTPAGEKYKFSQKRMAATTACNVVYPVYTQRQYIRHHAPGRWWDCLYTWDAGFIGMGLLNDDVKRGVESLNTYLNETDEQAAFIHHGTPLPVQHYLFLELWNKTQSKELLKTYYPQLKRYYKFLVGAESSTTRKFNSNLLCTWDYFYNSGGWDDYPPQYFMHQNNMEDIMAPVITTSHAIRIAKILRMAATELGLKADVKDFDKDIDLFAGALQKYSWDEKTGYFAYVLHDEKQNPCGKLLYDGKLNFNMGLGGLSPLLAGITTKEQQKIMLGHLKNPKEIWSKVGLSAVDQSAPYYKNDGYWNGTVWMPHQWFFWKTMLDLDEGEFAWQIAKKALDLWKQEVEASYNCMEHFVIESGRGAGWHEFSGLSTPVLTWFKSYFKPGTITGGLNVWFENKVFNSENSSLIAHMKVYNDQSDRFSLVVCMNPAFKYKVLWDGKLINHTEIENGSLLISLPVKSKGMLEIRKAN